ncbi:MAG: hypothetical protein GY815_19235 [Gammaproteobacteria bacterium]|nr:hypothetical protein [Gammaproteobacteria bacterium]
MVTPVGANVEMTVAAIAADISAYHSSDFFSVHNQQPFTMTGVPREFFDSVEAEIDEGGHYGGQADNIIKMAIQALRETVAELPPTLTVPLVLAMPETRPGDKYIAPELLFKNLLGQQDLPLSADKLHCLRSGRAAGIEGISLAKRYLFEQGEDYVLIGGSDSYWSHPRLNALDEAQRVLTPVSKDGFAPGEAAGFILLTADAERAMQHDNQMVSLPGCGAAEESGHLYSQSPYLGDGLDQAFKQALGRYQGAPVDAIYSSMNGENHAAKEYGVAFMRSKKSFHSEVRVEHPADCYGDLGAATSPILIALAATDLFKQPLANAHLVYSSSDGPARAAVLLERNQCLDEA